MFYLIFDLIWFIQQKSRTKKITRFQKIPTPCLYVTFNSAFRDTVPSALQRSKWKLLWQEEHSSCAVGQLKTTVQALTFVETETTRVQAATTSQTLNPRLFCEDAPIISTASFCTKYESFFHQKECRQQQSLTVKMQTLYSRSIIFTTDKSKVVRWISETAWNILIYFEENQHHCTHPNHQGCKNHFSVTWFLESVNRNKEIRMRMCVSVCVWREKESDQGN